MPVPEKDIIPIELTAPAGSFTSLQAAIKAGADSIYFGVGKLNMRARAAQNFIPEELPQIVEICHSKNVRCYLALNTILYDNEICEMQAICNAAQTAGVDAVIASDMAAIQYAHQLGLEVHISTQANVSNFEAVKFFARYADIIVLARELTIAQVKYICDAIREQNIIGPSGNLVKIELFIHGALCVSISGKCYMSLSLTGHSANRGDCFQTCRRSYKVVDDVTGDELVIDNHFVMSPRDLCTIGFMDKLIESGASVLKIEGRGRREEYVYTVTRVYREAISACLTNNYTPEKISRWETELAGVFNRGFWHGGYYMGRHIDEWSRSYGSQASKQKIYAGYVKNYFPQAGIAELAIESHGIARGDTIIISGPTTGYVETRITSLLVDDQPVPNAGKGTYATIPVPEKVRRHDKLYIFAVRNDLQEQT
ncbi:MAG TPA: peptidase U32 family protein [bacterium]|nr:peptidase U32 family protein [bacterium]HPN43743.1 peptidase U32 family protein [bacterium]